jgi:CheY-like chemotaxis protein
MSITELASRATEQEASPGTRPRVLVVDDDTTIRDVVGFMLDRLEYSAETATSGREALLAVTQSPFGIVLMDINMPEMNGIEATRRIRSQLPKERQPAIIAMTANSDLADQAVCIEAGMDFFLSKPVRMGELASLLANSR